MRYELSDYEWSVIRPMLPNKPRGVPRVGDRRILNGIFWVLRAAFAFFGDFQQGLTVALRPPAFGLRTRSNSKAATCAHVARSAR
jgi:transposase